MVEQTMLKISKISLLNFLGSALTTKTDGDAILQGIVSFGVSECGTRGAPCNVDLFYFIFIFKFSQI